MSKNRHFNCFYLKSEGEKNRQPSGVRARKLHVQHPPSRTRRSVIAVFQGCHKVLTQARRAARAS